MIRNLSLNKTMWVITALLALSAATLGVFNQGLYEKLVDPQFLPGTVSQDLVTIVLSLLVLFWAGRIQDGEMNKQVIIIGIMGYLFYGYGIWVIEQMYNSLYLLYLAIFGCSFYSLVFSIASIRSEAVRSVRLTKPIRNIIIGWSLLNPIVFYPLWIMRLIPLMQTGQQGGNGYSVFILDICFVMPAFFILAVKVIKNDGLGLVLLPALFVKGFTLLFSVGLGGIIAPFFGRAGDSGQTVFYLGLSAVFLLLTVIHLRGLTGKVIEGKRRSVDVIVS